MSRISDDELRQRLWTLFPRPHRPVLERRTTALLCVDLQYLDAHPDHGLGAKAQRLHIADFLDEYWRRLDRIVILNVVRLQTAARAAGVEVIHARVAATTRDGRDASLRYRRRGTKPPSVGEKEAEFIPAVAPKGDELVFNKTSSSAFNSTNIDRVLRNLGIKDLIVAGVVTNGCVEATVRSAAELDYGIYVVEDATAAMGQQLHDISILNMSYKEAAIVTTDEAVPMLAALAQPGRPDAAPEPVTVGTRGS